MILVLGAAGAAAAWAAAGTSRARSTVEGCGSDCGASCSGRALVLNGGTSCGGAGAVLRDMEPAEGSRDTSGVCLVPGEGKGEPLAADTGGAVTGGGAGLTDSGAGAPIDWAKLFMAAWLVSVRATG